MKLYTVLDLIRFTIWSMLSFICPQGKFLTSFMVNIYTNHRN